MPSGTWGAVWIALAFVLALVRRNIWIFVWTTACVLVADGNALVAVPKIHSFPSGHTATAFAGATALSFFFPRAAPAFFVLAAAIGYSRLYVGVHFPLDVLGGAVIGVATALLLLATGPRRSGGWLRRG